MKKAYIAGIAGAALLAGGILALDFALTAQYFPEEVNLSACTQDDKTVTATVGVYGAVEGEPSLSEVTKWAWAKTASELDSDRMQAGGYGIFEKNFFDALAGRNVTVDADMEFYVLPKVSGAPGSCKP